VKKKQITCIRSKTSMIPTFFGYKDGQPITCLYSRATSSLSGKGGHTSTLYAQSSLMADWHVFSHALVHSLWRVFRMDSTS
jgi:hypothetical protein